MFAIRNDFLIKAGVSVLFAMVAISSMVTKIPDFFVVFVSLIAVSVMTIGFLNNQHKIRAWRINEKLDDYGYVCGYIESPNPSSSMISALARQGVYGDQIKEIKLQTCSLNNKYLEDDFFKNLNKSKINNFAFEIVGTGTAKDAEKLHGLFPNGKVFLSKTNLEQHFNLIKTVSDEVFIWFEPVHKESGSAKFPPQEGAFLIRSNDAQKAYMKFNEAKAEEL